MYNYKDQIKKNNRIYRVRKKIHGTAKCPRMSVFISNRNIYVQLIDDNLGKTILSCSTLQYEKEIKSRLFGDDHNNKKIFNLKNIQVADVLGKILANDVKKNNIDNIIMDRGRRIFHGKIKKLFDKVVEHINLNKK